MTATDDDAGLVLALFVKVFWIGIHLQAQFLGTHQLRIVDAGVHAEDNGIVGAIQLLGIPAPLRRQDTLFGEA